MNILHLASWYPTKQSAINGIFIKKNIEAISRYDRQNKHYLLSLAEYEFVSWKQPLRLLKFLTGKKKAMADETKGVVSLKPSFVISHQKLFGTEVKQMQRQIEKMMMKLGLSFDLIHAHVSYPAGAIAQGINRTKQIPYIISEQMGEFPFAYLLPQKKRITEAVLQAKQIIALSRYQQLQIKNFTVREALIIPNAVDVKMNSEELHSIADGIFKFVLVGLLTPVKGVDLLIEAVSLLKSQGVQQFSVTIVGSGKSEIELKQLAVEKGVEDYFSWKGICTNEETLNIVAGCNAFVCASRHESFGVALVEAMMLGLPVVATKCGGPEDTVNERNGILTANQNPVALAEGMKWMMANSSRFDKNAIIQNAKEKYSGEVVAASYLQLYQEQFKN